MRVQELLTHEVNGSALRGRVRVGVSDWIERLNQTLTGGSRPGALAESYESSIAHYASRRASPLLGEEVVRAWYDALYYTSIERQFRIGSDHHGLEDETTRFLKDLGTTESQPGRDVRDVLAIIKSTKFGTGRGVIAKQLLAAKNLGAGLRADLFTELARMHSNGNRGDVEAEPAFIALLDTRPTQRFQAGLIALFVTGDPMRRELYLGSAIEAAPNGVKPGYVSYFASITGDTGQLRRLIDRPELSPYDRAWAAIYLAQAGDTQGADRGFERLFRETDYSEFYSAWAGMMNERRDWKAKERVARDWLDKHPDRDIRHAYYSASLGDALEQQGRYAEAWTIVEPDIEVWSANILEEAVSLHQRLGRVKESDDLGRQMVQRYPGAWTRSGYAVVLWRQKRWADAAALFDPKLAAYSADEWDEHVPGDMATSFEHSPDDMASAAGALVAAGVPTDRLNQLVTKLREGGHAALAFAAANEICKRHPLKNDPDTAQEHIEAYRALAAWKGQPFAIRWLRERLTDQDALQVASILFENREDEAVLALADFAPRVRTDEMQVFLAGAVTRLRLPDSDPRVVALRNEVVAQKYDPAALHAVTRYFLGLMDEKDFITWAKEPWARSSVLYAIGLKSAAAGDYDRGLRYMLAARHVAFGSPPQAWAEVMLGHWNHESGTWRDIVARRIL
jgi:tetratricopeptide (TPR) repeat protein